MVLLSLNLQVSTQLLTLKTDVWIGFSKRSFYVVAVREINVYISSINETCRSFRPVLIRKAEARQGDNLKKQNKKTVHLKQR